MKFDISTLISIAAILVMLYCLFLVIALGKRVPGRGIHQDRNRQGAYS